MKEQVELEPEQSCSQLEKRWWSCAVASRVTEVPRSSVTLQAVRPVPAPQLIPLPVTYPACFVLLTVRVCRCTKFAVTVSSAFRVCVQTFPLALSQPVQPVNRWPEAAVAVSSTSPSASTLLHTSVPVTPSPQLIPPPTTLPPESGLAAAVSVQTFSKLAVTVSSAPRVCAQALPLALSQPVQSLKRCPEAAVAVRFTTVPEGAVSVQSVPQSMIFVVEPDLAPVTAPPVLRFLATVSVTEVGMVRELLVAAELLPLTLTAVTVQE